MVEKRIKTPNLLFFNEPIIDVARRCAEIIAKYGEAGKFTEKGLDKDGFELINDFVWALGLQTQVRAVKINKGKIDEE